MINRMNNTKIQIEHVEVAKLIPYARNSRTHSPAQVKQIAASIREFGFMNPVLIDANNTIIAGHGRVMAAEHLQLQSVPCVRHEHLTEAQQRAYVIADNKLAMNADWDEEMLKVELDDLHLEGFDVAILGFSPDELSGVMSLDDLQNESSQENPYSQKINIPTYEPKGDKPSINDLYDETKTHDLIQEINNSNLDDEEKLFLISAATRHTVFNYANIANFYAHASKDCQQLMEKSALVIIDYDKAIEQGLVKLTKELDEMFGTESDEE